jgi:magnesium-transporting ATPase (P-type)
MLCGDNFAPIARAVREGRTVFDNIMKSLRFTLPTNIGQAGAILIALIAGLALAFEPAEPLVTRATGSRIVFFGMLTGMATFGVFDWELARGQSLEAARTAAVNMLAFSEIASLFHVRAHTASALRCTAPCCMTIRLRFG